VGTARVKDRTGVVITRSPPARCVHSFVTDRPRRMTARSGRSRAAQVRTIAMRAQDLEGPREVSLHGHADRAARRDDTEQHARSMGTLGTASEEHVEPELREVLELALGGRVVDGHLRVVDEASQRVPVISVVCDRCRQRVRRPDVLAPNARGAPRLRGCSSARSLRPRTSRRRTHRPPLSRARAAWPPRRGTCDGRGRYGRPRSRGPSRPRR
jgi:hypothetical protein